MLCADAAAENDSAGDLYQRTQKAPATGGTASCCSKGSVCIDQPKTGALWREASGGAPAKCLLALLKAWYEGSYIQLLQD